MRMRADDDEHDGQAGQRSRGQHAQARAPVSLQDGPEVHTTRREEEQQGDRAIRAPSPAPGEEPITADVGVVGPGHLVQVDHRVPHPGALLHDRRESAHQVHLHMDRAAWRLDWKADAPATERPTGCERGALPWLAPSGSAFFRRWAPRSRWSGSRRSALCRDRGVVAVVKVQSTDQPNFVQHGPAPATASLGVIEPVPGELHLRSTRVTGYAEIKTTLHCAELKRAEAILTKGDVRWALEVEIVTIPEFWTPQLTRERVQQNASGPSFLGSLVRFSARYASAIPVQYLG